MTILYDFIDPERDQKRQEAEAWYAKKLADKEQAKQPTWMSIDPEKEKKRKEAEDWYQQQLDKKTAAKDGRGTSARHVPHMDLLNKIDENQPTAQPAGHNSTTQRPPSSQTSTSTSGRRTIGDSFDLDAVLDGVAMPDKVSEAALSFSVSAPGGEAISHLHYGGPSEPVPRPSNDAARPRPSEPVPRDGASSFDLDAVLDTTAY